MKCKTTLVLGERDAFCFVWLVSVSTRPGFIGIAGSVQIPVFPRGEVPRKRHCKAAQEQASAGVRWAALAVTAQG